MSAQLTDRELLEFAAKAAGMAGKWGELIYIGDSPVDMTDMWFLDDVENCSVWDPLTDDGDALRLAVEMRMTVDVHLWRDEVQVRAYDKLRGGMYHVDESGETGAATRRAVVRAAAEIGKAMP